MKPKFQCQIRPSPTDGVGRNGRKRVYVETETSWIGPMDEDIAEELVKLLNSK